MFIYLLSCFGAPASSVALAQLRVNTVYLSYSVLLVGLNQFGNILRSSPNTNALSLTELSLS